jgi:hypothetical protein
MTEQTADQRRYEMRQQLAAWEEQRKLRREQEERDQKRGDLETYLQGRTRRWLELVGTAPPNGVLLEWQAQFVEEQALVEEGERQARLAEAEAAEHYPGT